MNIRDVDLENEINKAVLDLLKRRYNADVEQGGHVASGIQYFNYALPSGRVLWVSASVAASPAEEKAQLDEYLKGCREGKCGHGILWSEYCDVCEDGMEGNYE